MMRHNIKHIPSLLLVALLLTQLIFISAGRTASAQPIPLPTEQTVIVVLPLSTDEPMPTDEPLPTDDITAEPTVEVTPTATPTLIPTNTETPFPTLAPSDTPVPPTATPTLISTDTETPTLAPSDTPVPPTATPTLISTDTETPTLAPSDTPVPPTATPTLIPTDTEIPTLTPSNTPVPSTATPTLIPTDTEIPTLTPSNTPVPPTATPTLTLTPFAWDCTYSIASGDVYGPQGLIWAINQANANTNPDIICLASGSTYSVSQTYEFSSGLPAIKTPITLRGYNSTLLRSLMTRSLGEFRLLYVDNWGSLQVENVTIIGGRAPQGGAIFSAGTLILLNSVIDNNSSTSSGGGIYIGNGNATITNTTLQNNRSFVGAGIYTAGGNVTSVKLNKATFVNNQANNTGGGLFNFNANVTINESQFVSNIAPEGAAIRNQVFGQMSVSNTVIRSNSASMTGGGIMTDTSAITANNNCFLSNTATTGSAVYTPVTDGAALNFEFNWWGRSSGAAAGEIYGNIDPLPALLTAPAICQNVISR